MSLLRTYCKKGGKVLEVGGGHAQLTRALLEAGYEVWVQGSEESCAWQLTDLKAAYPDKLYFVCSSYFSLPFDDKTFDCVTAIRLLAHVEEWEALVTEMGRVSARGLLVDYPPSLSFNVLYPFFFRMKRWIEGPTTRTYQRFSPSEIAGCLSRCGFRPLETRRQHFLPMAFHRMAGWCGLSRCMECVFAGLGLTKLLGSPAVLYAEEVAQYLLP